MKTLWKACVGTCCVQGLSLGGQSCLLASALPPLGGMGEGDPSPPLPGGLTNSYRAKGLGNQ